MKAIKVVDKQPVLVDVPEPRGNGVKIRVVSSSICGSDIHLMNMGAFGDHIIGHEFAGVTSDGQAVAIEPITGCGQCACCDEGHRFHCEAGLFVMGVLGDGGMAQYVSVPPANLVRLPTGLDVRTACLIEPLAVALHGLDRARVQQGDRALVIGAGPIGLATVAALRSRGISYDVVARYEHQKMAAEAMGAQVVGDADRESYYDVVMDAVGSSESLQQSGRMLKPMGRVGLVGVSWGAVSLEQEFFAKEPELIPSLGYQCKSPSRNFAEAGAMLHRNPDISGALVTHRFPLDGVTEAFATAADRQSGAIKVVFDVA